MMNAEPSATVDLAEFASSLGLGATTETTGASRKRQSSLIARTFLGLTARSAALRRRAFRHFFEYLARRSAELDSWTQMNYGYADLEGDGHTLPLAAEEEPERFCHQLHHRVVSGVDLAGKKAAEVSCGRGGGASFVHRTHGLRKMTGIDIAPTAIEFCRQRHVAPGLEFHQGDAENLPLEDESVDAITNVEASFCYGDMARFLAEVRRVLRPGGHFLFADLRFAYELPELFDELAASGLEVIEAEDITPNVLRALELDHARRVEMIRQHSSRLLRGALRTFAGTNGSRMPRKLAEREMLYLRFVARRPLTERQITSDPGREGLAPER